MRNRSGFLAVDYMMAMAVILLLVLLFMQIADRSTEDAHRLSCLSNLAQLGQSLQMYAQDNNGRFPPKTNDLRPLVALSGHRDVCLCPSDRGRPENDKNILYSSYSYSGGYRNDDPPTIPLLAESKARHFGLYNVYYLGGSARSVRKEHWKPFAPAPRVLPMKSEPEDDYSSLPPAPVQAPKGTQGMPPAGAPAANAVPKM